MKKKILIALSTVLVIALAVSVTVIVSNAVEKDVPVASYGEYTITETDMTTFMLVSSIYTHEAATCEEAAWRYAKMQFALSEIAGTDYAVSSDMLEEFRQQESASSAQDAKEITTLCEKSGISREEYDEAMAMTKFYGKVLGQHFSLFLEEYYAQYEAVNGERPTLSVDESKAKYNDYVADKLGKYAVLNEARIQGLAKRSPAIDFATVESLLSGTSSAELQGTATENNAVSIF